MIKSLGFDLGSSKEMKVAMNLERHENLNHLFPVPLFKKILKSYLKCVNNFPSFFFLLTPDMQTNGLSDYPPPLFGEVIIRIKDAWIKRFINPLSLVL